MEYNLSPREIKMKLIREAAENLEYLVEETNGKKNVFIEGIFAQYDTGNRNNRIYPKAVMEKEVNRYQEIIEAKRSLGELGHPPNPSINLDKVSHLITSLKMESDGKVIGRAKILETPMGLIAKNLIENDCGVGVSTRGLGSLKAGKDGLQEVQDDFHLATIDIVSDPSAPDAFVQGIMENAEWICDNGIWKAVEIEMAQKQIKQASAKELEEEKLKVFERFLSKLSR
jgi:hypothetical protein